MAKVQCICPCGSDELVEVWSGETKTPATFYLEDNDVTWETDDKLADSEGEGWFECFACERTFYDLDELKPVTP